MDNKNGQQQQSPSPSIDNIGDVQIQCQLIRVLRRLTLHWESASIAIQPQSYHDPWLWCQPRINQIAWAPIEGLFPFFKEVRLIVHYANTNEQGILHFREENVKSIVHRRIYRPAQEIEEDRVRQWQCWHQRSPWIFLIQFQIYFSGILKIFVHQYRPQIALLLENIKKWKPPLRSLFKRHEGKDQIKQLRR